MNRRTFLRGLALGTLAAPLTAEAQPAGKLPRVGYIWPGSGSDPARLRRFEAFRQGLRDLGYVEGRDIALEPRLGRRQVRSVPCLADRGSRCSPWLLSVAVIRTT